MKHQVETVVIGGGQAGLAAGHHLARRGRSFVILDANERVGDSWRGRWDSLRVFTPAKYNGLPGMRFPAPKLSFPTKDEVADYMAAYAARFDLPVRTGVKVECLRREGGHFIITTSAGVFQSDNVIVATGSHHVAQLPVLASQLDPGITQMHSSVYKSPAQLRAGAVLVVGLGNSGAEISYDLRNGRHVYLSGRPMAELPVPHGAAAAAFVLPLIKFLGTHVLNYDTPMGRKVLPKMKTAPLIRVKVKDLVAAGIERVPRVTGVRDGKPQLADGRTLDVANVIWCTGFRTDFGWIDLPGAFDAQGRPVQHRGVVAAVPGMYFLGLAQMYSAVSDVLPGVGRDAAYVAGSLVGRVDAEDRVIRRDAAELGVR